MPGCQTPTAAPPIEADAIDVVCPRCAYSLRGLPQPRCPECGLEFEWAEVIAAATLRAAAPTFEYHWRARPVRSLLYTLMLSLWPWRLWQLVPVTAPPRVGALLGLLACVVVCIALLDTVVELASVCVFARMGPLSALQRYDFRWLRLAGLPALNLGGALLLWPGLMCLWQTRQRARVRPLHLFRVTALAWVGYQVSHSLFFVTYSAACMWWRRAFPAWWYGLPDWIWALPFLLFFTSVAVGLRRGLRFGHGWADTALALVLVYCAVLVGILLTVVATDSWDNDLVDLASEAWPDLAVQTQALFMWLMGVG